MSRKKTKKTKAQKRAERIHRNSQSIVAIADMFRPRLNESPFWTKGGEAEDWQKETTQAFVQFVEFISEKVLAGTDSAAVNPLGTRKKIYSLARIAWNVSSDSDSQEKSIARLDDLDTLPVPDELKSDVRDWLRVMIELKWKWFLDFRTYVEEIEFTKLPDGNHDLAITMSRRVDDESDPPPRQMQW